MRILSIYRKTLGDLANPKLLVGYFLPLLTVSFFFILALTNNEITEGAPLFQQQAELLAAFVGVSYLLAVGMPLQGLCAVFCALTIASEAERGTLRILLSKPVRRWELYLGTFLAIVSYAVLVGLASLFVLGSMLYLMADVSAAAIGVGIFSSIPGALAFGAFGAVTVTAVGLAVAVVTKDRLRTALGGLLIPALLFIFIPARLFAGDIYEEYALYLVDVNYHFGHVFVFLYEALGVGLTPRGQRIIMLFTGVYEAPAGRGHLPESLQITGHLPVALSVALLAAIAAGALAVGLVQFQRLDV